jgi:hypothetical protein
MGVHAPEIRDIPFRVQLVYYVHQTYNLWLLKYNKLQRKGNSSYALVCIIGLINQGITEESYRGTTAHTSVST